MVENKGFSIMSERRMVKEMNKSKKNYAVMVHYNRSAIKRLKSHHTYYTFKN